jgi:hypothetical protein
MIRTYLFLFKWGEMTDITVVINKNPEAECLIGDSNYYLSKLWKLDQNSLRSILKNLKWFFKTMSMPIQFVNSLIQFFLFK